MAPGGASAVESWSVASDLEGGYFFSQGSCVRRALYNASIVSIAGTCGSSSVSGGAGPATSVLLGAPRGITLTGTGGILFADQASHCVRIVNSTGYLVSMAGTCGVAGTTADGAAATLSAINQPFGVAMDMRGGFVFTVRERAEQVLTTCLDYLGVFRRPQITFFAKYLLLGSSLRSLDRWDDLALVEMG